jgi:hypothetical protein
VVVPGAEGRTTTGNQRGEKVHPEEGCQTRHQGRSARDGGEMPAAITRTPDRISGWISGIPQGCDAFGTLGSGGRSGPRRTTTGYLLSTLRVEQAGTAIRRIPKMPNLSPGRSRCGSPGPAPESWATHPHLVPYIFNSLLASFSNSARLAFW